jgi:hypothetical protein
VLRRVFPRVRPVEVLRKNRSPEEDIIATATPQGFLFAGTQMLGSRLVKAAAVASRKMPQHTLRWGTGRTVRQLEEAEWAEIAGAGATQLCVS